MKESKIMFSKGLNTEKMEEKSAIPYSEKNNANNHHGYAKVDILKRQLGILQGKAFFKMKQDYKMTEAEFLGL